MSLNVGVAAALSSFSGSTLGPQQASNLLRAADLLIKEHQRRLSKPVGAIRTRTGGRRVVERSRAGEYPRADTGMLRAGISRYEKTVQQVMASGRVFIGLRKRVWYGAYLEVVYQRLGLARTLQDMIVELQAMAGMPLQYQTNAIGPAGD